MAYNCIGWAVDDTNHVIWPMNLGGYWWPDGLPRDESVETFVVFFERHGFVDTNSLDVELEPGTEKIAIFAHEGRVTHVARQLSETGWWTSKLGDKWDIEHARPRNLEGTAYGEVVRVLAREAIGEVQVDELYVP